MDCEVRATKIHEWICRNADQRILGIDFIVAELRAAQEEVLEKAAEVVEQEDAMFDVTGTRMKEIADRIRKLAGEL